MRISQAGLSKSISSLEAALGVKLFVRSRQGLSLTKEGIEVMGVAKVIMKEAQELEIRLSAMKTVASPDRLRIGMYDSVAVYFFPELANYLAVAHPRLTVELTVDTSSSLSAAILAGGLDLAVAANLGNHVRPGLEYLELFEDHYSFYVSVTVGSDFSKLPLLIHPKAADSMGRTVEDHLAASFRRSRFHRVHNFETLKILTSQGLGIGVLPTQVARPLLKKNVLINAAVEKHRLHFGLHSIGLMVSKKFIQSYGDFSADIYRLGVRWSKN